MILNYRKSHVTRASAIMVGNLQKLQIIFKTHTHFSNFQILNYKRANWDLVLIQKTCSEKNETFWIVVEWFWIVIEKHKETKPLQIQEFYLLQNNSFPFTFNFGWIGLNCDWMLLQSTNKANLDKFQKNIFFQNSCFLFKPLLKNCKKQVHKGYPLAGPCICNYKLKWTFAMKNNIFGNCIFSPFSFYF